MLKGMTRFIPSEKTLMILLGVVLGTILVALFIFWLVTRQPSGPAPVAERYNSMSFGLECQKQIEAKLKAPGTAKFESPWPVRGSEAEGYAMSSYVDAENSFGATLRQGYTCTYDPATRQTVATLE